MNRRATFDGKNVVHGVFFHKFLGKHEHIVFWPRQGCSTGIKTRIVIGPNTREVTLGFGAKCIHCFYLVNRALCSKTTFSIVLLLLLQWWRNKPIFKTETKKKAMIDPFLDDPNINSQSSGLHCQPTPSDNKITWRSVCRKAPLANNMPFWRTTPNSNGIRNQANKRKSYKIMKSGDGLVTQKQTVSYQVCRVTKHCETALDTITMKYRPTPLFLGSKFRGLQHFFSGAWSPLYPDQDHVNKWR